MKFSRFVTVSAIAAGLTLISASAFAGDKAQGKGAQAASSAGNIKESFQISPKGLKWGMSLEAIAKLYDKVIEDEMLPLFQKAQPGLELDAVSEEQKNRKGELRRSRIEFGNTPTGVDQSPLKGEYSYRNSESLAVITLPSGTKRHFFFFNDRLWKVYDEHKLKKGGGLGENFQEALKALTKRFGVPPKVVPADYDKGRPFDEAEWRDPDKVIRAVDRGQVLAVVYADRKIQENLANYRKNKVELGGEGIDKDVAFVTKSAEEPKPSDKGKDKDKNAKPKK
ncbi:MAG TPA: hypothetical protein VFQ61_28275 [Polyangiaceae bacterium]|nr:hypothetical protein [Polyangiaceae bacterium]